MISAILLVIITIFLPPVGCFLVAGCGADLLINICLTILGFFPGHIHAFYVEYQYFKRRDQARAGIYSATPAAGVYSDRVNYAGSHGHHPEGGYAPVPPNSGAPPQNYGTVPAQ